MSLFPTKYLNDKEIWKRVFHLRVKKAEVTKLLSNPEISTDPEQMPPLAKQLHELQEIVESADRVEKLGEEARGLKAELESELEKENEHDPEFVQLYQECVDDYSNQAKKLYRLLLDKGYINEEKEDKIDLRILYYIRKMGPEYAWRLGVNLGIGEIETRERLEVLRNKGLLKRVQGTMLDNYHRQKDWTKHMNHTYYRLSRRGDHYLRNLR